MRIHLVTVATIAMVALVSGCAERPQMVASASNPCRDPRLRLACHQVEVSGEVVEDADGEVLVSGKGKEASKAMLERRGAAALIVSHVLTPPPAPSPPHVVEPKSPPRPPPRH